MLPGDERACLPCATATIVPVPLHPLAGDKAGEALLSGTTHVIHANALMMKEKKNERTIELSYHQNEIGILEAREEEEDGRWDSLWNLKVIP